MIAFDNWRSPAVLALGQALICMAKSRVGFEGFVNWVLLPRLGPSGDPDGVTA